MDRIWHTSTNFMSIIIYFKYITLSRFISEITVMKLCPGIHVLDINNSLVIQRRIVPHVFEFPSHKLSNKSNQLEYLRSDNCADN